MIKVKYFKVHDVFTIDGLGPSTTIGCFTNEEDALEFAKKRGNYNKDAKVSEVNLVIAESIDEMEACKNEKIKNEALRKLTEKEREVLGF